MHYRDSLLRAFRSVMPGAAGVVLVDESMRRVAGDVHGADADALVERARGSLAPGASTLLPFRGALVLIVQVPSALLDAAAAPAAAPA